MRTAFAKTAPPRRGLEPRLVDERAQVVLIRQLERRIVLVEPMHHHLQPAPGVEARCPCVGIGQRLRLARRIVQVRPFGLEERELRTHGVLRACSASRNVASISSNLGGVDKNIGSIAA